jgi:hypothetical protein
VLPFLSYTQPRLARNLLRFRHSMLDRARGAALKVVIRGEPHLLSPGSPVAIVPLPP